jgi:hypothetical protein
MKRRGTPDGPPISDLAPGCITMMSALERSIVAVKPLPMPMKTPVMARTSKPDRASAMTAAIYRRHSKSSVESASDMM